MFFQGNNFGDDKAAVSPVKLQDDFDLQNHDSLNPEIYWFWGLQQQSVQVLSNMCYVLFQHSNTLWIDFKYP